MHKVIVNDQDLVRKYLAGSEDSFEILVNRHKNKIFSYIMLMVKNHSLAEDLFQETFIKVINTLKGGSYSEEGKFLPWVTRIAHNLVIDHFRKAKKMQMSYSTDEYDVFSTLSLSDPNHEEKTIKEQIHKDLRMLIELLPQEQKEVLLMRHYADMSFKEISEMTNVSINTSLGRMRYALINLRKLMNQHQLTMVA